MIEFVRVNTDYIDALRKVDSRVQSNSPAQGKETKPFLGVLFTLKEGGIKYYAPISSAKPKHQNMCNGRDFHKILDSHGNLLSVINFNNMLPVSQELCKRIDFATDKDKFLLQKEYTFCRDNEEVLKEKAKSLYLRYYKGELNDNEKKRTCDFRLLEEELKRYQQSQRSVSQVAAREQPTVAASTQKKNTGKEKIEIEPLRIIGTAKDGYLQVKLPGKKPEDIKTRVTLPESVVVLNKERTHIVATTPEIQQRYMLKMPGGQVQRRLK